MPTIVRLQEALKISTRPHKPIKHASKKKKHKLKTIVLCKIQ